MTYVVYTGATLDCPGTTPKSAWLVRTVVMPAHPQLTSDGIALATYEYLITMKDEHMMLRERRWSAATWLYLFNRYVMLGLAVKQVAPYTAEVSISSFVFVNRRRLTANYDCTGVDVSVP